MAEIGLEGMRFHAFHGVYPEEKILGTEFSVDLVVQVPIDSAAKDDNLAKTVNYEVIYEAVRVEMEQPHALIETLLEAIINRLKFQFQQLEVIFISIKKQNPPLGGRVAASTISDKRTFKTECPRCKKGMICYGDVNCWCQNTPKPLWPATQNSVKLQYKKCLCPACLDFFAG
jgi:dihydroneopterin aldolase